MHLINNKTAETRARAATVLICLDRFDRSCDFVLVLFGRVTTDDFDECRDGRADIIFRHDSDFERTPRVDVVICSEQYTGSAQIDAARCIFALRFGKFISHVAFGRAS